MEQLANLLEYDPSTGSLKWLHRGNPYFDSRFEGKEAGSKRINHDGHKSVQLAYKGVGVQANKLIWFIMTGEVPTFEIDHINGDGWDNRWLNLRKSTASENCYNRKRKSDNTTGFKGVSQMNGRFRAMITVSKKRISLGCYDTPEEAHEAYKQAAIKYHGEFANFG
ncbi:homing endonuclease [Salmonella phage SE5]|uniref:Homing endonuclease n=1 Tax=Salmonella phage SE5 TaxID=2575329 RepID=A0A5B9N509_9CAUD|nr:homing endonuclease [Salmonella phage SE5]